MNKPKLISLSPAAGPMAGGTVLVIRGKWFADVERVRFGTCTARFKVVSAEEVIAYLPAGAGTVAVSVKTAAGTSPGTKRDDFTYLARSDVARTVAGGFQGRWHHRGHPRHEVRGRGEGPLRDAYRTVQGGLRRGGHRPLTPWERDRDCIGDDGGRDLCPYQARRFHLRKEIKQHNGCSGEIVVLSTDWKCLQHRYGRL